MTAKAKTTEVTFVKDKDTKRFVRYVLSDGPIVGTLYVSKEVAEKPDKITVALAE